MNVIVVSVCDPVDLLVIRTIRTRFDEVTVIRPVWRPSAGGQPRSLWSRISVGGLKRRVDEAVRRRRLESTTRETGRLLSSSMDAPGVLEDYSVDALDFNSEQTAALVRSLAPDVIVLTGAPILKANILEIPRLAVINVHYGVAPAYRGEDTIFWPLYLADYDNVGVTLHHVDEGLDTGRLIAIGYPELVPSDTEATVFVKCARLAGPLLLGVLERLSRVGDAAGTGRAQGAGGRLFLRRHRTAWRELHSFVRSRLRTSRPPARAERTERYDG